MVNQTRKWKYCWDFELFRSVDLWALNQFDCLKLRTSRVVKMQVQNIQYFFPSDYGIQGCNAKGSKVKILEAFWEYTAGRLTKSSSHCFPTLPEKCMPYRTCCQQQVRTCVFRCWQHGDAQEEPLCTAAGVNVSISKYLIHCREIIVSFL